MPTIAELLTSYRDRTGASYGDMARKVRDELQISRLQQLATAPPKEFPKRARTIELLAELLEVPVATIVLGFAAGLGIPVRQEGTLLERTLPPGTDILTAEDRDVIRQLTTSLVKARRQADVIVSNAEGEVVSMFQAKTTRGTPASGRPSRELRVPEPPEAVAARRGRSQGKESVRAQDVDAETPDDDNVE